MHRDEDEERYGDVREAYGRVDERGESRRLRAAVDTWLRARAQLRQARDQFNKAQDLCRAAETEVERAGGPR